MKESMGTGKRLELRSPWTLHIPAPFTESAELWESNSSEAFQEQSHPVKLLPQGLWGWSGGRRQRKNQRDAASDTDMLPLPLAVIPRCQPLSLAAVPGGLPLLRSNVFTSAARWHYLQGPDFSKLTVSLIGIVGFVCWGKVLYVLFRTNKHFSGPKRQRSSQGPSVSNGLPAHEQGL